MSYLWNVLTSFTSFFNKNSLKKYTEDDYNKILFSETNSKEEEQNSYDEKRESSCQHRRGKITKLSSDYGIIDSKYYFDLSELDNKHVQVNEFVRYLAYRCDVNSEWKIKQVVCENDDWCDKINHESLVIRENVVVEKVIISQITSKKERKLILEPGSIRCNLDKISSEFLPIEGDWVELTAVVELEEDEKNRLKERIIEIKHLKAQKMRMYSGKISHICNDGNDGIINSEVYFRTNMCEPGFTPAKDDMVIANVIESYQGVLKWRAIFVIPVTSLDMNSSILANVEGERLFDSKNGVHVTLKCDKKFMKIREKSIFNVCIENAGSKTQVLVKADLKNSKINNTMKVITVIENPISILPSEYFNLTIEATASVIGFFSDILILTFKEGWQIGSVLDFYVEIEEKYSNVTKKTETPFKSKNMKYEKRASCLKKLVPTKNGFMVPGVRPIKPASFIPIRLNHYSIPENIRKIISGENGENAYKSRMSIEEEFEKLIPYMVEEFNEKNYTNKFHTLLHLEDLELLMAIKKYDKERTCFERQGEYLVLQIPNLAESRPSLVVGDKLVATVPTGFGKDDIRYEGFIHKVTADSIRLKFNESFHQSYCGKDYSITFFHNRTGIRRCHQAIDLVYSRLGKKWLFPNTCKNFKSSQVNIIGEHPSIQLQVQPQHVCKSTEELSEPKSWNVLNAINVNKEEELCKNIREIFEFYKKNDSVNTNHSRSHSYATIKRINCNGKIQWEGQNINFKSGNTETKNNAMKQESIKRHDVILKWVNQDLNCYQKEAIRNILKGEARPLPYVIFGPPGTGKTITVVETVLQIMYLMPESRILMATPSNSSADLICQRLLSWNLLKPGDLVRLVGYNYMLEGRISDNLKPYVTCIDMKASTKENVSFDDDGIKYSSREVIGRNRITIGTCVSVGVLYTMGFPKGHFTHIIIDEAGQATEPEILIPLAFMNEESYAILAGDPRQLGPVVLSEIALSFGLGESLLSRLLIKFPYHRDPESFPETDGYDPRLITRLIYNYRSLPEILDLYSTLFYESKLKGQICGSCSYEAKTLDKIKTHLRDNYLDIVSSVIFYGIRGINKQDEDSPSWYNEHEICQVAKYLVSLYNAGVSNTRIGIITPYQKQVMKIREHLRYLYLDMPKVGTVEEFQGQEREIIILSTVRSDEGLLQNDQKYALGFVNSRQRLNVAISRARILLIIIGNPHLLAKDISWRNLLKMCIEKGYYFGTDFPASLIH